MNERAFSLVELSIVLVILGLLVGGVLAGRSLIRASELRSAIAESQRFIAATHAFRDKYTGLPGDLSNAESFWGQLASGNSACYNGIATGLPTCNGDGNGYVDTFSTRSYERYRFWHHLVNAGLVEGSYSGTWDATTGSSWTLNTTNSPASKLPKGVWGVMPTTYVSGTFADVFMPANSLNYLCLTLNGGGCSGSSLARILVPEEAWNIDTKLDDGRPALGKVTTGNNFRWSTCSTTNASDSLYVLTTTSEACPLYFGM